MKSIGRSVGGLAVAVGIAGAAGEIQEFGARQFGRAIRLAQMEETEAALRRVLGDEGAAPLLAGQHALRHQPVRRAANGADGAGKPLGQGLFGGQGRAGRELAGGDLGHDGGAHLAPNGSFDIHAAHLGHIVDWSSRAA